MSPWAWGLGVAAVATLGAGAVLLQTCRVVRRVFGIDR